MNSQKLLRKALTTPNNLRFAEIMNLAEAFGFRVTRTSGSHHIYTHPRVRELVNLQEVKGKAKPYQVPSFFILWKKKRTRL